MTGESIGEGDSRLTGEMRTRVRDPLDREYESIEEFKEHSEGKTDHLGHLAGKWVRFPETGVIVFGEKHTEVTLPDVIRAVSGKKRPSFLYEAFSTDEFEQEPRTKATYQAGLGEVRDKFGASEDFDWGPHALESLYPKMGETMSAFLRYLEQEDLEEMYKGPDSYLGEVSLRYLKIAWAYGEDMQKDDSPPARAELAKERVKGKSLSGQLGNLAKARRGLGSFIEKVPDDGNLARELIARKRYRDPVRSYMEAIVDELRERGAAGAVGGGAGEMSLADKEQAFRDQRDINMANRMKEVDGIRYVGVGATHLGAIRKNLAETSKVFHFYQMIGGELRDPFGL